MSSVYKRIIKSILIIIKMDDFYTVLPSNSKSSIENKPSKFLTTFEEPIYLNNTDNWEVGLVEINFKNSIKTINEDNAYAYNNEVPTKDSLIDKKFNLNSNSVRRFFLQIPEHLQFLNAAEQPYDNILCAEIYDGFVVTPDDNNEFRFVYSENRFCLEILGENINTLTLPPHFGVTMGFLPLKNTDGSVTHYDETTLIEEKKLLTLTVPYNGFFMFSDVTKGQRYQAKSPPMTVTYKGKTFWPIVPKHTSISSHSAMLDIKYTLTYSLPPIGKVASISPKPGTYSSAKELETELNSNADFKKYFEFLFDDKLNRFDIISHTKNNNIKLVLENGLADVIGFTKTSFGINAEPQKGDMEVNLLRGITNLFIYCDLCEPIRVGDTQAPLLRTVAFNQKKYGEMINLNYINPMYVKVNKTFIDTVQIMICDASGELIPFNEGLTTVILHFKRV